MAIVVLILGLVGTSVTWWVVRVRGVSIWKAMPASFAALGVIAVLLTGTGSAQPRARTWVGWADVSAVEPALWGLTSGLVLFGATRLVFPIFGRWDLFARQTAERYEPRDDIGRGAAVALSLLAVAGEELLWRWGVQQQLGVDAALAAGVTWGAYVVANLASISLPIIAVAAVGGAVWGLAGWLSGGVLAPLCSHAVWTMLMLLLPPPLPQRKIRS